MKFNAQNWKLGVVFMLALMVIAMAFGVHVPPEDAAGLSLLAIGDTEVVGAEIKALLESQGKNFEEFKRTHTELLQAKADGKAVSDLEAKLAKIDGEFVQLTKDIGDIAKKQNRPAASASGELSQEEAEHKQAFREQFLRKGNPAELSALEKKVFRSSSDVDGGYFVDGEMETAVDRVAQTVSAVRGLADVRSIGKKSLEFRVKKSGVAARWVGDGEAGGETANPQYAKIEIPAEEMEIEPHAYNDTLDDADFDVVADLIDEGGIGFGEAEAAAFVSGDGIKKPRGFLTYPVVANASYDWAKVGYIASGGAGAFAASTPANNIIDLLHSLKAVYRNGAVLLMNDTTLAAARKIQNAHGDYIFNIDATGKFQGFIWGAPVVVDDNMPSIAANSYSIAYANWQRAYRIVDRKGIIMIRDNLTTKGITKFNMRKRVGGGMRNFEAIKLMKFAAS
jgi:HK97 family phage major capsid protein